MSSNNRKYARFIYENTFGRIPKGKQLHHIIPIFDGGDILDITNMEVVTTEEHYKKHYDRWLLYNDIRDLYSCQLLKNNHLNLTTEEKRIIASNGGKMSQKTLKREKLSAFYDPKLRFDIASKGGKNGYISIGYWIKKGLSEEEAINQIKKIQSGFGKKGGKGNKGFVWINDGKTSIKYTKIMDLKCPIDKFLSDNPIYQKGRLNPPDVKCPHCDKKGVKSAMVLHHFDKCKYRKGKNEDKIN